MTVKCKVNQCPYHDKRGFCGKAQVVGIDEMGMCSVLWKKGRQRDFKGVFLSELYPRKTMIIAETIKNEIEEGGEGESARQEDPVNGTAAS